MSDLVSVIIPTYNRPHLLDKAIESVLGQTHREIEIIVVDDGSFAAPKQAIERFGTQIRFFRQEHGSLNSARNHGLQEARGGFIALLDDDDLWLPFKTELQLAVMKRFPQLSYVFSEFQIFDETGIRTRQGLVSWQRHPRPWKTLFATSRSALESGVHLPEGVDDFTIFRGNLYRELLHAPYVLPSTALVRRSVIGNLIFPEDNNHCGDWYFFAMLSRQCDAGFIPLATTLNRSHNDAVRLSRKSPRVKTVNRLAMTEALWKTDPHFMARFADEVHKVDAEQLLKLSQLTLLEGRSPEARRSLRRWRTSPAAKWTPQALLLHLSAHMPFGPSLLQGAIALRGRLAS